MASSFVRFLDHTQRRIRVGRTPLDEWSARRRDLYLTTHNTLKRQTSMPPVGFEPTISVSKRPQTYALDRAATGTCRIITLHYPRNIRYKKMWNLWESCYDFVVMYNTKVINIISRFRQRFYQWRKQKDPPKQRTFWRNLRRQEGPNACINSII